MELKPRYLNVPLAEVYCVADGCMALDDPDVIYPFKVYVLLVLFHGFVD